MQIPLLGLKAGVIALPTNVVIVCGADRIADGSCRNASGSPWLRKGLGVLFIVPGRRIAVENV